MLHNKKKNFALKIIKLTETTTRKFAEIHHDNEAFPNSKYSKDHVSGWHSVHRDSIDAKIQCPKLLNPTERIRSKC